MTTKFYATAMKDMAVKNGVAPARVATPEFDKAWAIAYTRDRRARGIPAGGIPMPGEVEPRFTEPTERGELGALVDLGEIPEELVRLCKRGHQLTPENQYHFTDHRGSQCTACRVCRNERNRRSNQKHPKQSNLPRYCQNGHEFTAENIEIFVTKTGRKIRRCRACKEIKGLDPRRSLTHCVHGHEYTDENTIINRKGHRSCRACARASQKRHYDRTHPDHGSNVVAVVAVVQPKPWPIADTCIHGHAMTPANTLIRKNGRVNCRQCNRDAQKRHYYKTHGKASA